MEKRQAIFMDTAIAALLIAAIIYSSVLLADKTISSPVYRQSRAVSMLVRQDGVGFAGILGDKRNADMLIKFAGALTSAYINFELIPVNEAKTFVEVFESLPDGVIIESFEYRRRDLHIGGTAENESEYRNFLETLQNRGYFPSVAGSLHDAETGGLGFKIICGYGGA